MLEETRHALSLRLEIFLKLKTCTQHPVTGIKAIVMRKE